MNPTYPGPDSIHHEILPNGIHVFVYENFAAELVVIEGYLHAGALSETRPQAGLANFTASMLMRGTRKRSFDEIYEALESVGASVSMGSGRHITDFSGSSLVEDTELILDLMAESLRFPTFPDTEVEQVRGEIITGLQIREHDTRQMASLKFRELLYGHHPYGASVRGYVETVQSLQRADLEQFHMRHYGPQEMAVVVVGAIEAPAAVEKVARAFGDWENANWQAPPHLSPVERPAGVNRLYHAIPDKTQADIVLGWPGPERAQSDYLDASLANTVLGVFGMMGRLGKNVREEQGLAYYAISQLHGGLGQAPWFVNTGVAPDKVEQAIESILHEIGRMREELVPPEELADSKAYRTGSMPVNLETNDGLASVLSDIVLYGLGLDYLQRFPDLINQITAEQVRAVCRKYMSLDDITIVVVGPPQ